MTPLRQRTIAAMQMHGFSPRTHASDLAAVRDLAKYTHRSPDTLAAADLKGYFEHLVLERQLAPASVRVSYHGIRFQLNQRHDVSPVILKSEETYNIPWQASVR